VTLPLSAAPMHATPAMANVSANPNNRSRPRGAGLPVGRRGVTKIKAKPCGQA
jgi:hypothetical protein